MNETPNTAWRPFDPCRENVERAVALRKPPPGESLFFMRQLEYIRPVLYAAELEKLESMKLLPPLPPEKHERLPGVCAYTQGSIIGRLPAAPRPVPAPSAPPPPLEETWCQGGRAVVVRGTLAQVRAYFEARGCTVTDKKMPMRDATEYRIKTADGRWVCDFIAYWRSRNATAHCDWANELSDPGDEDRT